MSIPPDFEKGLSEMSCKFARAAAFVLAFIGMACCGCGSNSTPTFNEVRAFDKLTEQCNFGPRYTGTQGHRKMIQWLQAELSTSADKTIKHTFKARTAAGLLEFTNIYAVFNPKASRFVLLCAHWDTRPRADEEVVSEKRIKPILGANDGASGVAVLLELARMFKEKQPQVGVVMVFFDGEDYGPSAEDMFIGSKAFARDLKNQLLRLGVKEKPDYGILLDMVGDKDLHIPKEQFSNRNAPEIVEKVWKVAKLAGYGDVFVDKEGYMVSDDHLPIIFAGVKCIDIIDFDYAYWHTLDDTPDKCSAKSLKIVGDVVARVVYEESSK